MRGYSIGKRLLEGYLHQPYSWFLNHNSADLGKNILSEVDKVVDYGISALFDLISKSIVTVTLIALIILVDPKLTLIVGLSLGSAYCLIFYIVRNYLKRTGDERFKNNKLRFTAVGELLEQQKKLKLVVWRKFI